MSITKKVGAALATAAVMGGAALSAAPLADAASSYWCLKTVSGPIGIIKCGGKTPTKYYRVNVTCSWWNIHSYTLLGPIVSVKSGDASGKKCYDNDRATKVKAEWLT